MKTIAWDPLNLASEENLAQYQEAELKHGRLAMLAALGWPAAELVEPALAKLTGSFDELAETGGRAPSLLNGGFEQAQIPFFLLGTFAVAGLSDYYGTANQKALNLEPGNIGFDPLSLGDGISDEEVARHKMGELNNGRLAMIAISGMVGQELVNGLNLLPADDVMGLGFRLPGAQAGFRALEQACRDAPNEAECAKAFDAAERGGAAALENLLNQGSLLTSLFPAN